MTNGAVLKGSGTFNGVTLNGDLELTQDYTFVSSPGDTNRVNSTVIYVTNSFTLNGKMTLGDASGGYSANLLLRGPPAVVTARLPDGSQISYDTQMLDGDAMIEFGGGEYNALVSWGRTAFLTIGPNVTIRGRRYSVGLPRDQVSGPFQNFIGLLNQGTIAADSDGGTVAIPAGIRLSSGATIGCTNQGTLRVANGGTMNLTGPSLFNSGAIQVGSRGTMKLSGNYTQDASGHMFFEVHGLTAGTGYGQLNISGAAALDGALNLGFLNGFQPSLGDAFDLIHWGSSTGTFSMVNGTPMGGLILKPEYQATGLRLATGTP